MFVSYFRYLVFNAFSIPIIFLNSSPSTSPSTSAIIPTIKTVSVPTTSYSEHSNAPEIPKCVKRNSINRRKHPKVQKPDIEIKRATHRPRKSTPTEYATDEDGMITYDVKEDGLEQNPTDKLVMGK
ncbi:hypothetical protein TNCV_1376811 [Trichonephila clavipes]|nr:hypothetical protein TNCV_1376811 [Trichonephila clavipes]